MGSGFRRKGIRDRKGFWNGLAAAFAVALILVLPANQLLAQSSKITPVVEFFSVEITSGSTTSSTSGRAGDIIIFTPIISGEGKSAINSAVSVPTEGTYSVVDAGTGAAVPLFRLASFWSCENDSLRFFQQNNFSPTRLSGNCRAQYATPGVKRVKIVFTPTGSAAALFNGAESAVYEFTLMDGNPVGVNLGKTGSGEVSAARSTGETVAHNSQVPFGATVVFTADPSPGHYVSEWTGDCSTSDAFEGGAGQSGSPDHPDQNRTCTKTAYSDLQAGATFAEAPVERRAIVFSQPDNGALAAVSGGVTLNSGDQTDEGATITFRATPNDNWYVSGWTGITCPPESRGDESDLTSAAKECEVTVGANNLNVAVTIADLNECVRQPSFCASLGGTSEVECRNHDGGATCLCRGGYQIGGSPIRCLDVNECDTNNGNCGEGVACLNTPGSHSCMECGDGFAPNDDGDQCVNVNECTDGTHTCGSNAACTDTVGSFTCECNGGYQKGAGGTETNPMCEDVDECMAGTHSCNSDAQCENTVGGHACGDDIQCGDNGTRNAQTNTCDCDDGWTGTHCEADVDECADGTHTCGGNACTNADPPQRFICAPDIDCGANGTRDPATNTCDCASGWTGTTCREDVNECETNNGGCSESCVNIPGNFRCEANIVCANGGARNEDANTCDCINDWGGPTCEVPERVCRNGGTRDDRTNTCACVNDWGGDTCESPDRVCVNGAKDDGTNTCDCAGSGYTGTTCGDDIDECETNDGGCGDDEKCRNTAGSFACDRLPEVWIVAPAGEMFRAAPESGCEIRKWTESCDGRDAALSDCTPDGEGMVTVGVVFDCGN